jgi:DNA-binding CsgD family transcriptional regulator
VIAAEPALAVELSPDQLDRALAAIANFVDLKSPFTLGHSVAVAELAEEAGRRLGLPPEQVVALRRAGFVHGFGRLGVSNSIWDRPGPLSAGEWERIRMYPYLTERMLHQSAALAPLGEIAVQHRERLDGSGYPRGLSGGAISRPARVLGAADAYASMREPRPHRPARSAQDAAAEMRAEVRAGRLDGAAVDAVLEAAGHRLPRRREALAGLTAREVEVLILLARGLSNKQIAERLVITPKTAGNHVEHIYAKIDASSRAAAAMFAVQHGLLPEEKMRQSPHAPAAAPRLPSCLRLPKGDTMPRLSKDSAPNVQDVGPAVDQGGDLDDITVNFVTIRESHSLAPLLRGLPGDSCQCPHWGYLFAGKITVTYADREETYQTGDAFYMTPGHVPAAEAGTEFVQFSPKEQLAETMAAMMANAQRAMSGG